MESSAGVRIDKWLWAVRVYKTRSLATAACQAGHVTVSGQRVKPGRPVRPGEVVTARVGELLRTLKLLTPLERRVGARDLPQHAQDLTPPGEYERARLARQQEQALRPKGAGRPTKKERRLWQQFLLGPPPP